MSFEANRNIESIYSAIVKAIRSFFAKAGKKRAVVGISGGIDCAVTASLAVEALGNQNVTSILMPSAFSSLHSVADGIELSNNLGIKYYVIPINQIYDNMMKELEPLFEGKFHWDNTQENLQARIRGIILMAYSNRYDALLLNTSNKSELSVGYGTLYGDLAGALMVIGDIYKLQVYELASKINMKREIIPHSTMTKEPSAELRPQQKDSDTLPPYDILDPILYELNEEGKNAEQILQEGGVDKELLEKILKLRAAATFKANQLAPVIKISNKPLHDKSKWITSD